MARNCISATVLLVLIAQANSQFFDFFGFQPITQSPKLFDNEFTTKRTKIDVIHQNPQMSWKNTTISFSYGGTERDDSRQRETVREKKKKRPTAPSIPTLQPIFNYYTSTRKPVKKTTKVNVINTANNNRENVRNPHPSRQVSSYNVDASKNSHSSDWYDQPINNVDNRPYEATTKSFNYNDNNNRVIYNTNEYRPYYNRPGVKPIVVDNRPPITNKPVTQRPYRPETQIPYRSETEIPFRPETQRPYRPETERPFRPETQRPYRPETQRPVTSKPTIKPYIVKPIPTQAGAVVFPNEDDPPEIIRGPDEDYMSETEKRRYIEMAEKMCDKYKSLNTKQLAAIPLLPSPEPVSVNVSQCTPTQIPLVVGGKVVTINEFPHMALLGWEKIDGGGYSWKCGGSLISDQYVLTAAHCSYEERDNTVVIGPPRVVQLGSSYLDDPGALVVKVAAIIRHPKYKFPRSYHDLAILKLIQPVSFSEVIKPACLGVPPAVDQPIIATGWGKTEFGGDQSVELRSVSLPVWNMEKCQDVLGTSRKMPQGPLRDNQMCAGDKRGGKDTCQGDSGGPAQLQDGCAWRVVAVTSLGRSCGAPNTPGLYALVQRAFVSAAIFGNNNIKNNQRRSDNSQPSNNNNDYNRSNNDRNEFTTTLGYRSNGNHRTTTTTDSYYNSRQNSNRRITTTTETLYNPPQNDYGRQNSNRITTPTELPYDPPQNDYGRQNSNRRTTTTELPYDPPQNDYGRQNSNRRTTPTELPYDPPQNDYGRQNSNRRTTPTESPYDQPQNDYGRQNSNRRTTPTESPYDPPQNDYGRQNSNRRTTPTESPYDQPQNDYGRQNNNRRTTTTESYYNLPQNDYDYQNNNRRSNSYDNGYNNGQNDYSNTQNSNSRDTDTSYYNQERDRNSQNNNQGYNNQGSNNQPQNDYWGGNQPPRNQYEAGAIWFT